MNPAPTPERSNRRRRSDGERTRRAILLAAAELATVEGLDGLSIGRLAKAIGMSKSGLYAHFGSKAELQLAAIETAGGIFAEEVVRPALSEPEGVARLRGICEAFLGHVERRVFPGGCFFASAASELDTRPGPVTERVAAFQLEWMRTLERLVGEAQERGEIDDEADAAQLAFELNALLLGANASFVLHGDASALERARLGIGDRLERWAA
jgi:AcrR family transcriptional regulator